MTCLAVGANLLAGAAFSLSIGDISMWLFVPSRHVDFSSVTVTSERSSRQPITTTFHSSVLTERSEVKVVNVGFRAGDHGGVDAAICVMLEPDLNTR